MIYLKENGSILSISKERFFERFGVRYAEHLVVRSTLPGDFVRQCREFATSLNASLSGDDLRRFRDAVAKAHVAETYIAEISPEVGLGLFARSSLNAGEVIGEYTGLLVDDWKPIGAGSSARRPYLLKFPFPTTVAIDPEHEGNETRFLNHSSRAPNLRRAYIDLDDVIHVLFVASKTIPAGSQLCFDYGANYWDGARPIDL